MGRAYGTPADRRAGFWFRRIEIRRYKMGQAYGFMA